jgi:hypothetical protein
MQRVYKMIEAAHGESEDAARQIITKKHRYWFILVFKKWLIDVGVSWNVILLKENLGTHYPRPAREGVIYQATTSSHMSFG